MSYSSKVLYAGNGSQTTFAITFPYISIAHVDVYVNDVLQLDPLNYSIEGSNVEFLTAPESGDAIWIRRNSSPTSLLVDFTDGSVLGEAELDLAYQHNFYLYQEAVDSYNELVNAALVSVATGAGIVETDTDEVIAALVNEMLNSASAATLLEATSDIATNAESILSLSTTVDGHTASIATNAATGVTNANDITTQASLITTLQTDVANAEGDITTANINIAANVTAIQNNDLDILDIYAKYGVTLNVDGYITGFAQHNDGSSGSFVILADNFAIVSPSTEWAATTAYSLETNVRPTVSDGNVYECTTAGTSGGTEPVWDTTPGNTTADASCVWTARADSSITPFTVAGNNIRMNANVEINGALILNGTILGQSLVAGTIGSTQIGANAITTTQLNASAVTAAKIDANAVTAAAISVTDLAAISADMGSITAGDIVLDSSGFIRGGQTGYHTGTGFFLGYDTSAYKFSIGDGGTSDFMTWDGSELIVRGNVSIGNYTSSTTEVLLDAPTLRTTSNETFSEVKKFEINKPGTVRLYWTRDCSSVVGGFVSNSEIKVYLDGVQQGSTDAFFTTTPTTISQAITTTESSQYITVEYKSGLRNPTEPVSCSCNIWDVEVRAVIDLGEAVITD